MKKKLFLYFLSVFFTQFFLLSQKIHADLIATETCYVRDQTDDPSSPFSLRSAVDDFNVVASEGDRACTQNIFFQNASNLNVRLLTPLSFTGLGHLRVAQQEARSVTLDARALPSGHCALDLSRKADSENVTFSGMTLRVNRYEDAICGNQYELDSTHPLIIEVGTQNFIQECVPTRDTCCSETGTYLERDSSCTSRSGSSGICQADHSCLDFSHLPFVPIFIPTPQVDCVANSLCCDSRGLFQTSGFSCTTEIASPGSCNGSGTCIENIIPPSAVCGNGIVESGEICDGGSCCTTTCEAKAEGTICESAGQNGLCNTQAQCVVAATPPPPDVPATPQTPPSTPPQNPDANIPTGNSNSGNNVEVPSGGCSLMAY